MCDYRRAIRLDAEVHATLGVDLQGLSSIVAEMCRQVRSATAVDSIGPDLVDATIPAADMNRKRPQSHIGACTYVDCLSAPI
jgi:hypothetical protein